jgi:hypothetical protein
VRPAGGRQALVRAKARLDLLDFYPRPVDLRGVRIVVLPWLFRVPGFRRFRGYSTRHLVILRQPQLDADLIVHELCHVWQMQHRPLRMWLSYARPSTFSRDRSRYRANRYEVQARRAVELTRGAVSPGGGAGSPKAMTALEVPGPVEPDQPMPSPPDTPGPPAPEPPPGGPGVPEPSPPEQPDPGSPDVPGVDPKGPETPDSPPKPEPQIPAEPD